MRTLFKIEPVVKNSHLCWKTTPFITFSQIYVTMYYYEKQWVGSTDYVIGTVSVHKRISLSHCAVK